jgi:hypothetical protein
VSTGKREESIHRLIVDATKPTTSIRPRIDKAGRKVPDGATRRYSGHHLLYVYTDSIACLPLCTQYSQGPVKPLELQKTDADDCQ